MAYGNYAPFYRTGYFNPMQTPMMPNMVDNQNQFVQQYQAPAPMPNNDMIFVLGQNEAESYPVAPNATVTMWDKNQKTFYIKTADAQGIPSMQIYDFTERTVNAPKTPVEHVCKCGDKFVTFEAFNALQSDFKDLSIRFEEFTATANTKSKKSKENIDNE